MKNFFENRRKIVHRHFLCAKNGGVAGFTLLELLLYVVIMSSLLFVISLFISTLLQARVKNQAILEVDSQGTHAMHIITQTIRNAEAITSPSSGTSSSSLTLDVLTAGDDPTVFDISSDALEITEGASAGIILTNSRVTASGLTFNNLTRTGTPGTIQVTFTLSHVNPSNRNEFSYQKTFTSSASLRHP